VQLGDPQSRSRSSSFRSSYRFPVSSNRCRKRVWKPSLAILANVFEKGQRGGPRAADPHGYINAVRSIRLRQGRFIRSMPRRGRYRRRLQEGNSLFGSGPVAAGIPCAGSSATPRADGSHKRIHIL